jgi:carbon monoxide dehydrogenase subunit G
LYQLIKVNKAKQNMETDLSGIDAITEDDNVTRCDAAVELGVLSGTFENGWK